jgi:putative transposase
LEAIVRRGKSAQSLVKRARVILLAAEGKNNERIARDVGMLRTAVRRWRERWTEAVSKLEAVEAKAPEDKELGRLIEVLLKDEQRSGRPPTFTAEQIVQIVAVACEEPKESGRPISHWTPRELADEVKKRKIVSSISPRHVARFFRRRGSQATQGRILA